MKPDQLPTPPSLTNSHELHLKAAQDLYSVYNDTGPNRWRSWDGKPVPQWNELNDQVRAKWAAVGARAVAEAQLAVFLTRQVNGRRALAVTLVLFVVGLALGSIVTSLVPQ